MLATDEGKFQGGEDTAPTPLEFFLTGLVGCLMTQVRVFAKRLKIDIDDVKVSCHAKWEALSDEVGPYQGRPVRFEIDMDVTSTADPDRILTEKSQPAAAVLLSKHCGKPTRLSTP